jgi:hypothetical protein
MHLAPRPHPWRLACAAALACFLLPSSGLTDEDPVFNLTFRDGAIEPLVTVVPVGTRFKLVLKNEGKSPVEFESIELRREKVLGPGVTTFIVIRRLDVGEHVFFDDFHPSAPNAKLVATEKANEP